MAAAVSRVAVAVDGYAVVTREQLRRTMIVLGACAGLLALGLAGVVWVVQRTYTVADRLESIAGQVEQVAAEQTQAKAATERVSEKVDVAAAAVADKPDITIAPATTASAGGKAHGAVIVIKQARPKPSTSALASALPPAAEIRIPVTLPPSATAVPAPSVAPRPGP